MPNNQGGAIVVLILVIGIALMFLRKRWQPSGTAFGTARWASEEALHGAGMLAGRGLILGRTLAGSLLWLPQVVHLLLVGGSGSGKGVSVIIPILLSYFRGSVVVFDMKTDLHTTTARRRGGRILRLAPFNGGTDYFNPLDTIPRDSTLLIDSARSMSEALVQRTGMEHDNHWGDKAVQTILALTVLVLLRFDGAERSLNSVQELASDPGLVLKASEKLKEHGGIPARLGSQLTTLFESGGGLTKEGAGVLSTVSRHLSFLDSVQVAQSVATSTFRVEELLKPGTTLYLQIPSDQLDAQKGLLRCWIATFLRVLSQKGSERNEVLFVLDEASALNGLKSVEEALVRGRSGGIRLVLAFQSCSQVETAFKDKKTLLYDNCNTHLYLGTTSYETADRISKSLGERTQVISSYGENNSRSWQQGGMSQHHGGENVSQGWNLNYSENGRALLKPEEVLQLDPSYLIAFVRGVPREQELR